jgi:amino acid permease
MTLEFFTLQLSLQDGLAVAGNAPKIFKRTSRYGLPYVSLIVCSAFSLLSYMGVNTGSGKVFNWFANMTSIAGLMTWFGITVTYVRFYKGMAVQGYDRSKLPYASKLQPYAAWYGMVMCLLVCFVSIAHLCISVQHPIINAVQWMEGFPQRKMGGCNICDKLPSIHIVSYPLCCRQAMDTTASRQT